MGLIGTNKKVKLFCGILSTNDDIDRQAFSILENKFGHIDLTSAFMSFDYSDYYVKEMGNTIKRFWLSFETLIFADNISDIKIFTNSIEDSLSKDLKRNINIDPGYITQSNIILATTKNYSHRIYLSNGIYAEVTTIYSKKDGFIKLPWTYPDYLSTIAKEFFTKSRQNLLQQLKNENITGKK